MNMSRQDSSQRLARIFARLRLLPRQQERGLVGLAIALKKREPFLAESPYLGHAESSVQGHAIEFAAARQLDFDGKKWGELPGEVRSKIVQEMKAKYGEDYARMIKLYFEQLADTKRDGK